MLEHTNQLNLSKTKEKESYINDLFNADYDKNYRWALRPLIGKQVKLQSLEFYIETKTLTNEHGDYDVKIVVVKNGQITHAEHTVDAMLPIFVEHMCILVDNNLVLNEKFNKVVINGVMNEYVRRNGKKDIGIDAQTLEFSNENKITIPDKNDIQNEQDNLLSLLKNDNTCTHSSYPFSSLLYQPMNNPYIPEEFYGIVLNANECEFLGYMKQYGWEQLKQIPFDVARHFGGPYKCRALFQYFKDELFSTCIYSFLCKNTWNSHFNINTLSAREARMFSENAIIKKHQQKVYIHYSSTKEQTVEINLSCNELLKSLLIASQYYVSETIRCGTEAEKLYYVECSYDEYHTKCESIDAKRLSTLSKLDLLCQLGYLEETVGFVGTYEKDMENYHAALADRDAQISKIREQFGHIDFQLKEIPEPINHDFTYHYFIKTEKAQRFLDWLDKSIPDFDPIQFEESGQFGQKFEYSQLEEFLKSQTYETIGRKEGVEDDFFF